jgi:hypothetical protein
MVFSITVPTLALRKRQNHARRKWSTCTDMFWVCLSKPWHICSSYARRHFDVDPTSFIIPPLFMYFLIRLRIRLTITEVVQRTPSKRNEMDLLCRIHVLETTFPPHCLATGTVHGQRRTQIPRREHAVLDMRFIHYNKHPKLPCDGVH